MSDIEQEMNLTPQERDLRFKSIPKLLLQLAIPMIVAQVVNALYNIVDRIYIGNIPGYGSTLLTAVGLSFAAIILINACTALIGAGGAPLLSIQLGEKNQERAAEILNESFVYLLGLAVIIIPLIYFGQDYFLPYFGASDQTFQPAKDYLTIYVWGTPFVMIALGMNFFINAQGLARQGMISVLIGAVSNIILDPIFIFGFKLNVKGAAIATVISQGLSAIYVIYILTRPHIAVQLDLKKIFQTRGKNLSHITALGVSPFVMQSTEGVLLIIQNFVLQREGGDLALGAMVIFGSITQFLVLPMSGLTLGAQAITSYNFGAGLMDRVRENIRIVLRYATIWIVSMQIIVSLLPQVFIRIFSQDMTLLNYAKPLLPLYIGGMFLSGFQSTLQTSFIALNQPKISSFLAIVRKGVLLIPLILILPIWFDAFGVFLARPIADSLAAITTTAFFLYYFPRLLEERTTQLAAHKKA